MHCLKIKVGQTLLNTKSKERNNLLEKAQKKV